MDIRPETPGDYDTIFRLTQKAFEPMPFSEGKEAQCVKRLREDGDLTLSFVASEDTELVGHIAFSPVFLDEIGNGWYALGPVSVWPHLQGRGIGKALVDHGLMKLKEMEANGCILIGDPKYYSRFGFVGDGRIAYRNLPKEIVQWISFNGDQPSGILKYSPGLELA